MQQYTNIYGSEGVQRAIQLPKHEIAIDAAHAGIGDLKKIDASYVSFVHTKLRRITRPRSY